MDFGSLEDIIDEVEEGRKVFSRDFLLDSF